MNILAMLYSAMFLCLAMPELPPETITELQVIESNAESLAMASEGINVYQDPTTNTMQNLALFAGLYRGLQAWNEWNGGDDYIIKRQYVMERTDLPEWLANYSGDVIFWELEYFGHTIEMITDKDGKILIDNQEGGKGKAVNVRIKNNMIDAVQKYKVENPDKNNALVVQNYSKSPTVAGVKPPLLRGKDLYFYVYVNGAEVTYRIPDFTNKILSVYEYPYSGVYGIIVFNVGGENTEGITIYKNGTLQNLTEQSGYGRFYYYGSHGNFEIKKFVFQQFSYYQDNVTMLFPACYRNFNLGSSNTNNVIGNNANGIQNNVKLDTPPIGDIFVTTKQIKTVSNVSTIAGITEQAISADSLQDITDSISTVIPTTDPETGIENFPLPENLPLPEEIPLTPEEGPIPDGPVYPEFDFPIGDPEQVPESDPETAPTTEPTEINLPENAEEIPVPETLSVVNGLQNRFPFSIPWDIYNALSNLSAERQIPHWEWTMQVNMPFSEEVFSYTFVLDLGFMAGTVGLFRNLFLLAFILGLAVYSYNKFFGGGA